MKVRIITDSSVDVSEKYKDKITVVPLAVRFGDEEYLDGVTLNKEEFYHKLVESDVLPTTSQGSPVSFKKLFDEVEEAGESAVVITISSKLSGTYQNAALAASDYENIYVVDSLNATIGSGVLAEYAMDCAEKGMEAKELAMHLAEMRDNICLVALLDTLEYLKKGGRISKTVAFAGEMLNIKPVVSVIDGEIVLIGKARGSKRGNNLLVEKIGEVGGADFDKPILLGYSGLSDALLKKYKEDSRHLWDGNIEEPEHTLVCSAIGAHVGPGAIAVSFFRKHD